MPVAYPSEREAGKPERPGAVPGYATKINLTRHMLRVIVNEGDKIDKALKQFKRKVSNTKLIQEARRRQEFEKPSVKARRQRLKAEYIQKLRNEEE